MKRSRNQYHKRSQHQLEYISSFNPSLPDHFQIIRESGANDIGTTSTIKGDSTSSETNIIFTRLGDT